MPTRLKHAPLEIPAGRYFTKAQAAENCGVARKTVQNWIENGSLGALYIPKLGYLIEAQTLAAFEPPPLGPRRRWSVEPPPPPVQKIRHRK